MRTIILSVITLITLCLINTPINTFADHVQPYHVIWNTPSKDHNGSMPIGNGDIGMNVWVEEGGDLVLLLSKTDAWSGNARLLKLGRVRLAFTPNPFTEGKPFMQELHLKNGEILINAGNEKNVVSIRIWVDAHHPVIRIEAESPTPFELSTTLDMWRTDRRQLTGDELHSAYGLHSAPFPVYVYPDTVSENRDNQIVWYHRNEHSIWENNLKHQGLEGFMKQATDPLMHRTFGASIKGTGLISESSKQLKSAKPQKNYTISIYPLCAQTKTAEQWLSQLDENISRLSDLDLNQHRKQHHAWWNEFWNRSWIRAKGSSDAETVTRGYVLQRWISACAGRGAYPIKFNGTIFTVDGAGHDADYRRWGGPYWWQNTRLPYWPMIAAGDFDMMQPLFRMYQDMVPLEEYRTKVWFDHPGAFIGETVYFWGMYTNENYGWKRDKDLPVGELTNRYIRREYTASPELMAMMIDYYNYTLDAEFLHKTLLPMCGPLLEFWDNHYELDENGKMIMYPAQALETLQDAANPTPDIAGLKWVLKQLLEMDKEKVGAQRRIFWQQLAKKVPPLPTEEVDGKTYILGAEKVYGGRGNSENPELYTVFPFRLFGMGKPNLETGRQTFERRPVKGNTGWRQDDTQAAFLGLTDTAKTYLVERAKNKHEGSRFPAFWGPNFDWIPDQDHGGNLMKALQTMLLQADNGKIWLMPAWPNDWDVDFKLHVPQQTIVEGSIKNGAVTELKVTPPERKNDVIIIQP